jgi:hypothetical protein
MTEGRTKKAEAGSISLGIRNGTMSVEANGNHLTMELRKLGKVR